MFSRIWESYRQAYGAVPRNVWLVSVALLVARTGTMVIPFLPIYFVQELGFRPLVIGWLLAVYGLGSVIASALGGWLTQRIGAIPTQITGLALSVPGFLLLGQANSFWTAWWSLFFLSLAIEGQRPAASTATVDFCDSEDQHTRALAVNRLAVNLGITIGPAVGGWLAIINYDLLFYVNAATMAASMLLLLFFFGWKIQPAATEKQQIEEAGSPWTDRRFVVFCILNAIGSLLFFQIMGTYPLYLKQYFYLDERYIGILFTVNTVVIVLFELVLVNEVRRFPLLRTFAWGTLLGSLGFGLLPLGVGLSFAAGYAFVIGTVLIWTAGEMLSMPLGPAYAARRSTPANRGRYMGMYVMSFSVAILIAPLGGMWLYEQNPHLLWFIGLIIGAAVFFGFLLLADREEGPGQQ